jgi:hypothetical protein
MVRIITLGQHDFLKVGKDFIPIDDIAQIWCSKAACHIAFKTKGKGIQTVSMDLDQAFRAFMLSL